MPTFNQDNAPKLPRDICYHFPVPKLLALLGMSRNRKRLSLPICGVLAPNITWDAQKFGSVFGTDFRCIAEDLVPQPMGVVQVS